MTIKELKDKIATFGDNYDDYEVVLWDYNHQRKLDWGGVMAFSKSEKTYSFAVEVPTKDGISIFDRLKDFCKKQQENGVCKKDKR